MLWFGPVCFGLLALNCSSNPPSSISLLFCKQFHPLYAETCGSPQTCNNSTLLFSQGVVVICGSLVDPTGVFRLSSKDALLCLRVLHPFCLFWLLHLLPCAFKLGQEKLSEREIYERDMKWLLEADAVIAEVSNASLGVGYEIARAEMMQKPLLCLYVRTIVMYSVALACLLCPYERESARLLLLPACLLLVACCCLHAVDGCCCFCCCCCWWSFWRSYHVRENRSLSAMIRGCPSIVVKDYVTLEEAYRRIDEFFGKRTAGVHAFHPAHPQLRTATMRAAGCCKEVLQLVTAEL